LTSKEKEELQNLVLSASGADYARGDVITVSSLQFESIAQEQAKQEAIMKEVKKDSTVDYLTTKLGPLLVVLILGLTALFIIRGLMSKIRLNDKDDSYTSRVLEPQLPVISDEIPDILLAENLPKIEANIDPELERARMELNDTILADPAEAARLLVSFIKD
jgi:flagellar M-ring protein FliF